MNIFKNYRLIETLSIAIAVSAATQNASAGTLLVGFHRFTDQQSRPQGFTKSSGDEGVFASSSTITYSKGSTSTGGSTDNWYGPDNAANGGYITNQKPFDPVSGGSYLDESASGNDRQNKSYAIKPPTPSPKTLSGEVSTADGRIRNLNGTDLFMTNTSNASYRIDTLLFDSYLGDVSTNSQKATLFSFPVTISSNNGDKSLSTDFYVSRGYAGYSTQSGESLDQALANPNLVNNKIDYGIGTNYLDYVVDLGGIVLKPGESISIGFNAIGSGVARGDNFAIIGSHLPEPMTALAFGGVLCVGILERRRRRTR